MKLVECEKKYWEFVRQLRLNPDVINGFIETKYFSPEDQEKYMLIYSKNYRICLVDGNPAGYVGVIDDDIRICTHPNYQKQGVGKFMIEEIMKIFPNAFAKIKVDNNNSLSFFESIGFEKKFYILKKIDHEAQSI